MGANPARLTSLPRRVAVFAFDLEEASQIRAIRAIRGVGVEVVSLSYRRGHMNAGFRPDWRDVPLGPGADGAGLSRLAALWRGAWAVIRGRHEVGPVDMLIARNLDMALLALLFRALRRERIPLVYQCFDIHGLMTGTGFASALARWVERRVLARSARVVITAPAFRSKYFSERQGYSGAVQLMENKICWPSAETPPPRPTVRKAQWPLRVGWVGTLRCPDTLALLCALAELLGRQVSIHLRGVIHHHQLPDIDTVLRRYRNVHYDGPYDYPFGLARAYGGLDAVWAQDLWQRGANSDWLLPNRIYEAGYFGCPCLAVEGTATAERIAADNAGLVVTRATAEAAAEALRAGRGELATISARLLSRPAETFCQSSDEVRAMLRVPRKPSRTAVLRRYQRPSNASFATKDPPS